MCVCGWVCVSFTAKKFGVTEVPMEAVTFISHATQSRLRTVVEKVSTIAQHRLDSCKVRITQTHILLIIIIIIYITNNISVWVIQCIFLSLIHPKCFFIVTPDMPNFKFPATFFKSRLAYKLTLVKKGNIWCVIFKNSEFLVHKRNRPCLVSSRGRSVDRAVRLFADFVKQSCFVMLANH